MVGWNKGHTKQTHPSVLKISRTMRRKKLNNFASWTEHRRRVGAIPSSYPPLERNGDRAELMGVVLGDGHIRSYPRTEELSIFSNANNPGFVKRYTTLVEMTFRKRPVITSHGANCVRIRIYQRHISKRLGVPFSPRKEKEIKVPKWILANEEYIVRYLRGLYEAEGAYCVHLPTSTHKLFFSNRNESMLQNVSFLLTVLGFHPHISMRNWSVQLSRKAEVEKAVELLQFRKY